MSYFGSGTPEQEILDDCKYLQDQGVSANKIMLALAKVLEYYAECECDNQEGQ